MIAFLVDHNFDERIIDGLTRLEEALEFTLAREVGLAASPDPEVLEWAGSAGLVILTHDTATMPDFAWERVAAGLPMPGVFVVRKEMPVGQAIDELLIAAVCLSADECRDLVRYFPM